MQTELKALSPWRRFEEIVRRALRNLDPNAGKFSDPIYGKINKVNLKGGRVDNTNKGFSVNVKPLNPDFSENDNMDEIKDVPLDSNLFGDKGGVFLVPSVGTVVRIGFMYADPSYPYILAVTNEGKEIPDTIGQEYYIETSDGDTVEIKAGEITLRIKNGPAWQLKGSNVNFKDGTYNSSLGTIIGKFLSHNHIGNMGAPTSPVSAGIPPITPLDFKTGVL